MVCTRCRVIVVLLDQDQLLNRSWGEEAEGGSGEGQGREEAAKGAAQAGRRRMWRPLCGLCGVLVGWLVCKST